MKHIEISQIGDDEVHVCQSILRSLPEWFGIDREIIKYCNGLTQYPTYAARSQTDVAGFISLKPIGIKDREIFCMAVAPQYHGMGIGSKLILFSEITSRKERAKHIHVKTLGQSHPSIPYRKTRHFYLKCGFIPEPENFEIWGNGYPCLTLKKPLY